MWFRSALLVAAALAIAGCGGDDKSASTGGFAKARGCSTLTAKDVKHVTGISANKGDLAPSPDISCSSAFFRAGTELVVSIVEQEGDTDTLSKIRAAKVQATGGPAKPVSGLGKGAFLAGGRVLGFRKDDTVVTLETGYSGRHLLLKRPQLEQIAQLVADRL